MKLFGLPAWFLAILFGLVLCLAPVAKAQENAGIEVDDISEDEEYVDEVIDVPEDTATDKDDEDLYKYIYQTREIRTTHIFFPSYPDMVIPTGKVVEAVIGIENTGNARYNMTYMRAQLLHPQERSYAIENYTANAYNVLVGPGEQHTFVYYFQANEFIQPRPDFGFKIMLIFNELIGQKAGRTFSHVVFDGTIELTRENVFDIELLLLYAGGAAVVAIIFYVFFKPTGSSSSGKKLIETGTKRSNLSAEDEWLEGTHAETRTKRRSKRT